MRDTLREIYNMAFPRFKEYIDAQVALKRPLCDLDKATFKWGVPDYENPAHVSLYLMRYSCAYISEYYLAFRKILDSDFLEDSPLSILAIGAGSNLDGLAACLAIKYSGEKRDLRYQGVEKAEWPLLMSVADRFHQIRKDVADLEPGDLKPNYKINILSFPKSLSELEVDKIERFIESGATSYFDSKLCVIFSNRNARVKKLRENELEKIKAVVSLLNDCPGGYSTADSLQIDDSASDYRGKRLHEISDIPLPEFPTPSDVTEICKDPGKFCVAAKACDIRSYWYDDNGFITNPCIEKIGRHPIKKSDYFDTHIFFMKRTK